MTVGVVGLLTADLGTYYEDVDMVEGVVLAVRRDCGTAVLQRDGSESDRCRKARPGWPGSHCYLPVVERMCLNYSIMNYPYLLKN